MTASSTLMGLLLLLTATRPYAVRAAACTPTTWLLLMAAVGPRVVSATACTPTSPPYDTTEPCVSTTAPYDKSLVNAASEFYCFPPEQRVRDEWGWGQAARALFARRSWPLRARALRARSLTAP